MVEVTPKYVYDSTFLHHFPAAHIKDEISTLFVVGFPENIQQREFQNMFLFSPGFEAATLKISSKAIDADLLSDNRKQIIGFVKFRTRLEALTAKQILCGKKIDTDCVLKAEMAKKNLHIKKQNEHSRTTAYEAFHSVSSDALRFDPFLRLEKSLSSTFMPSRVQPLQLDPPPKKKMGPTEPQANHHPLNMGNQFTTLSPTTPSFMSAVYPSKSYPITFPTPPNSASSYYQEDPQFSSSPSASTSTSSVYRLVGSSTNPADQNPPCNTLYVGNLPSKTSEHQLVALFSQCMGYKRLSFRTKSNGPMCFVEFNNISCATQALQDLHGIPLSNSTKDGIRLSFSKNPLGVRTSSSSSISK